MRGMFARVALLMTPLVLACSPLRVTGNGHAGEGAPSGAGRDPAVPPFALPDAAVPPSTDGPTPAAAPPELACNAASPQPGNAGCSFYAAQPPIYPNTCYAMFVVNPGTRPARLQLARAGTSLPLARVARVPRGAGGALTYDRYDEAAGLAPGEVAVLFLSGQPASTPAPPAPPMPLPVPIIGPPSLPEGSKRTYCPFGVEPALAESAETGRGGTAVLPTWASATGKAFHLTSDRPVIAYDINPYGGADSALTSASLLLPEETWGKDHVAATPPYGSRGASDGANAPTYLLVVAGQDGTEIAVRPSTALVGGPGGLAATGAGQVARVQLAAGDFLQLVQAGGLTPATASGLAGTFVSSSKPVALIGGTACFDMDASTQACDSGHQQIPAFSAWGHEYAAVRYRSCARGQEEAVPWQLVGAVDGTVLSYQPAPTPFAKYPAAAPTTLAAGQSAIFWTADPFVVRSQDAAHPFYVAGFMTGADFMNGAQEASERGAGDPEWVNVVPTDQYLGAYTFLTDPTYPETNLVVVRRPGADGRFADVKLACAREPLTGWNALGDYQFARVQLVTERFRPLIDGCANGRQQISSPAPFSVRVWGWGNSLVRGTTFVSYAYPAGAALGTVNTARPPVIE